MLLVKLKTFKHTPPDSVKFVSVSNIFLRSWRDSFCHIDYWAQPISSGCNILFKHYNNHYKLEILGHGENKSIKVNLFVEIYYFGFLLWNKFRIELSKVLWRVFCKVAGCRGWAVGEMSWWERKKHACASSYYNLFLQNIASEQNKI